jgi:DNA polymerase-2
MRKTYKRQQIESEYGSVEYNNAKSMQEVVKELSNSMYGITADPNSRFFDKRIAESITLTGQYLLKKCKSLIEEKGHEVIYGDTDSLFCKIDSTESIEPLMMDINAMLKEDLMSNFNLMDYIIELQYEKTFDPFVLVDKKRYTGMMTDLDGKIVNKIFTRGLEIIKKDTIEFTRKKLFELLDYILKEELRPVEFFVSWFDKIKEEITTSAIPAEDLKITKKLSKPIKDYKTKLPHVRLAEEKIKRQEILETVAGKHVWGQKIEYIITEEKDTKTDTAHGAHRASQMTAIDYIEYVGEFDRTYYFNVQVFNVLGRILKVVFPNHPWDDMLIKKPRLKRKAKTKADSI